MSRLITGKLLAQVFKTSEGANKRAAFENAHHPARRMSDGKQAYIFKVERWVDGQPDDGPVNGQLWHQKRYTWRIRREARL